MASRALEGRGGARRTEPPNAAVKVGRRPSSELPGALGAHYGFRPVPSQQTFGNLKTSTFPRAAPQPDCAPSGESSLRWTPLPRLSRNFFSGPRGANLRGRRVGLSPTKIQDLQESGPGASNSRRSMSRAPPARPRGAKKVTDLREFASPAQADRGSEIGAKNPFVRCTSHPLTITGSRAIARSPNPAPIMSRHEKVKKVALVNTSTRWTNEKPACDALLVK